VSIVDDALDLAELGLWVFPCSDNKRPLTTHGFKDAVNEPDKVKKLFEFYGDSAKLIGVKTGKDSDIIALDFDLYKGDQVRAFMDSLIAKQLLPNTRVHATKSGGVHVIYRGNGAGYPNVNPADGVEVRGDGGYIIWWPAHGEQVVSEGITKAPSELVNYLKSVRRQASEDSIDGLKQKILEAENFHDSLARLAARLSGSGMDRAEVMQELLRVLAGSVAASPSHPRHERWVGLTADHEKELSRIVGTGHEKFNSRAAGEQADGAFDATKLRVAADAFGFRASPNRGREEEAREEGPRVKTVEDFAGSWPFENEGYFAAHDHDLLSQRFILHPILCEDESILIAAEPKTGKTAIALTVGLHVATGYDLGPSLRVAEPRGVLYFGLEGRRAIRLRIAAWRRKQCELGKVLPDFIPLFVVERSKNLLHEAERQTLANAIKASSLWMEKEHGVSLGLIVIDTYTKAMPGGDQNSVEDTSSVFDVVNRIRELDVTAAVAFIHHKARAGNVRGSTNIEADPDVLTSIYKEGDKIVWNLDRARSVEEGGSYHFRLHNYPLGISSQGFAINAPVAEAIDAMDEGDAGIIDAKRDAQAMTLIIALGAGVHEMKLILDVITQAGLAPKEPARRATRVRFDSKVFQQYIADLIPETGYSFGGKTVDRVYNADHKVITHLSVR
jgi:hypothetical protein